MTGKTDRRSGLGTNENALIYASRLGHNEKIGLQRQHPTSFGILGRPRIEIPNVDCYKGYETDEPVKSANYHHGPSTIIGEAVVSRAVSV